MPLAEAAPAPKPDFFCPRAGVNREALRRLFASPTWVFFDILTRGEPAKRSERADNRLTMRGSEHTMPENPPSAEITRSLKRLTIAVWILAVVILLNLIVSLFAALFPPAIMKRLTSLSPELQSSDERSYEGFHDWPVEKQIAAATVIAVGQSKEENGRLKCIISEILKQAPNTVFYYKVGDEYRQASHDVKPGTDYGDGQIMFFTGSPATFRYSASFSHGRARGLGDMPLEKLKEMIATAGQ